MRIRDRLWRAWRWAKALLASPPPPSAPRVSQSPVSHSASIAQPPPSPSAPVPLPLHPGVPVVTEGVTLRMWPVADLVVLATTEAEAEGALVSLVGHPEGSVRAAATAWLDALRGKRAAAA